MHYVYLLRSVNFSDKIYIGYTNNIDQRMITHNDGKSLYTKRYMPWRLQGYFAFQEKVSAIKFEKYLKSGSGKAFALKHFF